MGVTNTNVCVTLTYFLLDVDEEYYKAFHFLLIGLALKMC